MPKGGKGKGRNKGKGGKGKGGGKGKQNKGQQRQQQQQKGSGGNSPKKHNNQPRPPNANQQKRLDELMLKEIDEMYSEHTQKHDSLRTFFGIFTRHNMIQLRQLLKVSIPDINERISDKFLKLAQNEKNRDINQFIFLGDVAIGVVATELRHKDCEIKAFCVLPYFRNFGCGSRLMVHLVKGVVKRKNLNSLSVMIDSENEKGIAFFQRFGFKLPKNGVIENGDEEKQKEEETPQQIRMLLDLKIFRASTMVLVKKQMENKTKK